MLPVNNIHIHQESLNKSMDLKKGTLDRDTLKKFIVFFFVIHLKMTSIVYYHHTWCVSRGIQCRRWWWWRWWCSEGRVIIIIMIAIMHILSMANFLSSKNFVYRDLAIEWAKIIMIIIKYSFFETKWQRKRRDDTNFLSNSVQQSQ